MLFIEDKETVKNLFGDARKTVRIYFLAQQVREGKLPPRTKVSCPCCSSKGAEILKSGNVFCQICGVIDVEGAKISGNGEIVFVY